MKSRIMATVIVIAYNHEKYIGTALDSIIKQKTDFDFEVIAHDDASTDNTANIIREYAEKYPEIIVPICERENRMQKGELAHVLYSDIRGKYFAILEGDDYWIDEEKLQKQVDFMEAHEDYSTCMHNVLRLNNETGETSLQEFFAEDGTYSSEGQIEAALSSSFQPINSCLFRSIYMKSIPEFFFTEKVSDYIVRIHFANCGKSYAFKKPMSVYRISVHDSYMDKLRSDESFYNDYTLNTIKTLRLLDDFTERKYDDIFTRKIISDYYGFCSSIPEDAGLDKAANAGLDMRIVRECYSRLSVGYLAPEVEEMSRSAKYIFIYGISRLGKICEKQMKHAGITIEGFVVSDGILKPDEVDGIKVLYLGEVVERYQRYGFVLGVQPINEKDIVAMLDKRGVKNYCNPYCFDIDGCG